MPTHLEHPREALLDRLPAVAWERDARTGRFVYVNEAAEALLGFPVARWTRAEFWESRIHPSDRGLVQETFDRFRAEGGSYELEYRMRTASGAEIWVRDVAALTIAHGRPALLCGVLQDVTAYRLAFDAHVAQEERLRRQNAALLALATRDLAVQSPEAALRLVTETAAGALDVSRVSVWRVEGGTLACLDGYEAARGIHHAGERFPVSSYLDTLRPSRSSWSMDAQHEPRLKDLRAYLTQHGIVSLLEAPVRVNQELIGVLFHEEVGRARRWTPDEQQFAASMADLVAQAVLMRRSRTALGVSEARTGAVVEASPDAMVVIEANGCIVQFNRAAEALFGRERETVIGTKFVDTLVAPDSRVVVSAALREALAGDASKPDLHLDLRALASTGPFPAEFRAFPLPHENDLLLAAFVRRVNGVERARGWGAYLPPELEERLKARTATLRNAVEDLESYSVTLAHELRAPLRAIDAYSQLLAERVESCLDAEGQHHLTRVRGAVKQASAIVGDVMLLARVSAMEMHREPVDLAELFRSLAAELAELSPARRVTLEVADTGPVACDRGLVRLLLDNLLRNAWKFTSGHPTAHIAFRATEEGGERRFCVEDDGAGFDPTLAEGLFVPFHRLHALSEFEGTGIGLVVSRRIVERHGGRIWAEGEIERGARFWFTLPEGC